MLANTVLITVWVSHLSSLAFSTTIVADDQKPTVSYEEVRKLKDDPKYLLIDVREPSELQENGSIPGAINIPLNEVEPALVKLTPVEFQEKYGRDKPDKDFNIIFSCRSGRRSGIAQEKAKGLGYRNVYNYVGSWLDWEKHNKDKN
ncbi:hypothetical protein NQ318_010923 [Aromia moschata]|uniref:Rhodanese domain-containing protein n=1 Tax=Aromia moschata TaxID=1265417 RepID=A0AAV8XDT2_9CUCU|nr:hypothetical protein NQ318_010923 [Aromia moschata]